MRHFRDGKGRQWDIAITLGTAMSVKDSLGVDLLEPEKGDPPLLTLLGTDEMLLGQVLCALLENQFEKHQITPAEVYDAFDGETLLAAQKAFYEDLTDFFQSRGRTDRAKAVMKQMALIDAGVRAVGTKIDAIDVEATIAGAMSGELPEVLVSTPAP